MNPNEAPQNLYSTSNIQVAPGNSPSVVAPSRQTELPKFDHSSTAKTVAIIILSVTTVAFVGLFAWMFIKWEDAQSALDAKIKIAVDEAINENTIILEEEFAEREKTPYSTFSGPEDYGNLSFPYPKTWSLYVARDASSGGNFEAYFNPGGVQPTGNTTVNALRVTISDTTFDRAVANYENSVKKGDMTMTVVTVNGGTPANIYRGTLQSGLVGAIAVIKIRDKSAIIQTDSTDVFNAEFEKILSSLTFNS